MVQIKTFYNYDRHELDNEVNEFISDKSIINIKFSVMSGFPVAYAVLVMYHEEQMKVEEK